MSATRFGALDVWLILVVASWGANFSVIKAALDEFPVHTFNALRQVVAALSFAIVLWRMAPAGRRVAFRASGPQRAMTATARRRGKFRSAARSS